MQTQINNLHYVAANGAALMDQLIIETLLYRAAMVDQHITIYIKVDRLKLDDTIGEFPLTTQQGGSCLLNKSFYIKTGRFGTGY